MIPTQIDISDALAKAINLEIENVIEAEFNKRVDDLMVSLRQRKVELLMGVIFKLKKEFQYHTSTDQLVITISNKQ